MQSSKTKLGRILCLHFFLSILLGTTQSADVDICIVGAGPSGIQAAYTANKKGYSVKVLEQNSYVGGKTKRIRENGKDYLMGAAIHSENFPYSLKNLIEEFGIESWPREDIGKEYHNTEETVAYDIPSFRVLLATLRYSLRSRFLRRSLDQPDAFLIDYPESLNMPLNSWLDRYRLSDLKLAFWFMGTCFGYDDMNTVPALYLLKFYNSAVVLDLLLYREGGYYVKYQDLLEAMANSLPLDSVVLDAQVTQVDYNNTDFTSITYSRNQIDESVSCGSTIIAFPQTLKSMSPLFIPNNDAGLTDLLGKVKYTNYYTLLFDDSNGDFADSYMGSYSVMYDEIPNNPSENLLYWKQHDTRDSFVSAYFMAASEMTDEQVKTESLAHYSKLSGVSVNASSIRDFNKWEYFPRVSSEDLNEGFYKSFDEYQGVNGQFYTGGLFNFETVESAMQHGDYIVNRFFD